MKEINVLLFMFISEYISELNCLSSGVSVLYGLGVRERLFCTVSAK